jgi:hypothetical protein
MRTRRDEDVTSWTPVEPDLDVEADLGKGDRVTATYRE